MDLEGTPGSLGTLSLTGTGLQMKKACNKLHALLHAWALEDKKKLATHCVHSHTHSHSAYTKGTSEAPCKSLGDFKLSHTHWQSATKTVCRRCVHTPTCTGNEQTEKASETFQAFPQALAISRQKRLEKK